MVVSAGLAYVNEKYLVYSLAFSKKNHLMFLGIMTFCDFQVYAGHVLSFDITDKNKNQGGGAIACSKP